MSVVHIVLFKLKDTLSDVEVKEFCGDMLSLRQKCKDSSCDKPYIVSSSGGKDNSPEGAQGGFTHGFVVEFASLADRDHYVNQDPDHLAFVRKHSSNFDDVRVIDYEKGVY